MYRLHAKYTVMKHLSLLSATANLRSAFSVKVDVDIQNGKCTLGTRLLPLGHAGWVFSGDMDTMRLVPICSFKARIASPTQCMGPGWYATYDLVIATELIGHHWRLLPVEINIHEQEKTGSLQFTWCGE